MDQRLERILPRVQKPARYTGGEYRQIIKDKAEVDLRLAFCFPDIYEIGMSNIGMRILYATMNQMPGVCIRPQTVVLAPRYEKNSIGKHRQFA